MPVPGQAMPSGDTALWVRHSPERIQAALVTLHGGPAADHHPVRPWQLSALRMRPVARIAASAVPLETTLLGQVRYRQRGWNEGAAEVDTLWALSELNRLTGDVPVVLLGHAMGARAALRAAVHPQVLGVVALAPWLPKKERVSPLTGRSILIMHGDSVPPTDTEPMDYVQQARAAGARAGALVVHGGGPRMLHRAGVWQDLAARAVGQVLRPDNGEFSAVSRAWSSDRPLVI
ncbi:alpha/beta hydrolase [Streptomyces sp. NPDC057621]|uniref:alpha/beta hydrolase n=1 Tax=Streptomyces sp. NPDC057621 TaxID=3346186 RepID=UPI003689AB88